MKKVIIIGAGGMAGHMIQQYLQFTGRYQIIPLSASNTPLIPSSAHILSFLTEIEQICTEQQPDIVINCAGVLTKKAETFPDAAILLNSYLPHLLASLGNKFYFKMIQLSTDCEFSGKRGSYTETDLPDATDMYGRSKALGEVNTPPHLNIRTSFIGPELKDDGIGLFHWLMKQQGQVSGYTNAIWTGVTTLALAEAINSAIEKNISGLYQLVNGQAISKCRLLELIKEVFQKENITIVPKEADRYSDKSLVSSRHELPVKDYKEMLIELKSWMLKMPQLYSSYFNEA